MRAGLGIIALTRGTLSKGPYNRLAGRHYPSAYAILAWTFIVGERVDVKSSPVAFEHELHDAKGTQSVWHV